MKTAKEFYDFYDGIPEERWCTDVFTNGDKCCARGHLGEREYYGEYNNYVRFSKTVHLMNLIGNPGQINDGYVDRFQQPTPKQRILAALKFAMEEGK